MKKATADAAGPLASGQAWSDFCDGMKAAGQDILRASAPKTPLDLAEGHRYLTHVLRSAFDLIVEGGDPQHPRLQVSLGSGTKLGWDNPDNLHHNAVLRGDCEYRLSGTRGDAHYFSLGVYAGSYAKGGGRKVAFVEIDSLEIGADRRFEVVLSARAHSGNWIRLEPDTTSMMLRQIFWDRATEQPAELRLERIDARGPVPPLDPAFMVSALQRVIGMVRGTNQIMFDWADRFRERPNQLMPGDAAANERLQGVPAQTLASGWWEIGPEQAAVIDFPPPRCRYWNFVLSNYWGQSFDYTSHATCVNARGARTRADGSVRLVVAHRDPGLDDANWLDTAGHASGVWQFRWLEADGVQVPTPRVVDWTSLGRAAHGEAATSGGEPAPKA